jgi:hypothetical protein
MTPTAADGPAEGRTAMPEDNRLHVGTPKDELTEEDMRAFAACERLLNGIYRLSETGHREDRAEYLTDDTAIEMEYRDAPESPLRVFGKPDVLAWYDRTSAARRSRGNGPRLHVTSNFVWARRSRSEVECNNVLTYYEFSAGPNDAASSSGAPRLIADCLHRFRFEGGLWRMSHKYYWILYSALSAASINADPADGAGRGR